MICPNPFQQQQEQPEPAEEAEAEGFETILARIQGSVRHYVDSFSSQSQPPFQHQHDQHQHQHQSNHHDRQSLALPTQFHSSSANHDHGHANEEDEEDEDLNEDEADAAESERASFSFSASGSHHDDHPNSSTSVVHRGHYHHPLWLWTWCKNNPILLSFFLMFIAVTLSTGCLVYKNRQLQNQNEALENELRWTLSARLDALLSASEEGKEEQKGKGPTASSSAPSVSSVGMTYFSSSSSCEENIQLLYSLIFFFLALF